MYICRVSDYASLAQINFPQDLKKLDPSSLPILAQELRRFIIDEVSQNGGHFSANLGVVELTIALHYVLNCPHDRLIWDVGHQAYAHKILTGRRHLFSSNRRKNGISGFPKLKESPYDHFGTGHSSTSISAMLGMAISARLQGEQNRNHVAVIGDGALTGGMAFEALNHAGVEDTNLLVVLNDNSISIDPNVGALKEYLARLSQIGRADAFKQDFIGLLQTASEQGLHPELTEKLKSSAFQLLGKDQNFFESLNIQYFGPVDGHDIATLVAQLQQLLSLPGPKLLHVLTLKGKGFAPAEAEQTKWHATGKFDKLNPVAKQKSSSPAFLKYQEVFGKTLLHLALHNEKIIGITPAMPSGCSMDIMMKELPKRVFDVGIAEQHAVTLAAGIAADGLIPFCNLYSTFAQRAYDQIIHDVAVQQLPVVFCLDRAGLVGADGPTHHGAFDMAFMRCLPNMVLAAPLNAHELSSLMYTASIYGRGPFCIRYPRGQSDAVDISTQLREIPIGKGQILQQGEKVAILSIGSIGQEVTKALENLAEIGLEPTHADMRFVKPLDADLILELVNTHHHLITVEDGCLNGGFGSAVLEFLADQNLSVSITRLGIPDEWIEQAEQTEQYQYCKIDAASIYKTVKEWYGA